MAQPSAARLDDLLAGSLAGLGGSFRTSPKWLSESSCGQKEHLKWTIFEDLEDELWIPQHFPPASLAAMWAVRRAGQLADKILNVPFAQRIARDAAAHEHKCVIGNLGKALRNPLA